MARLQAVGVGKLISRAETQSSSTVVDSLSIRGTGHTTGSHASRSPSHGGASGAAPSHLTPAGSSSSNNNNRNTQRGSANRYSNGDTKTRQHDWRGAGRRGRGSARGSSGVGLGGFQSRIGGPKSSGGGGGSGGDRGTSSSFKAVADQREEGGEGKGEAADPLQPWTGRRHPHEIRFGPHGAVAGVRQLSGSDRGSSDEDGVDGGGRDVVTIHVCDESRGITKDFCCERRLLLREMKYFQTYLVGASNPYDEIDILVHCDVRIFEWLFQYIHSSGSAGERRGGVKAGANGSRRRSVGALGGGDGGRSPSLEVSSAVSILISADFLQMRCLVLECLSFLGEHLSEIVKLPIDLSCLGDKMVLQLAKMVTLEQLAVAKDRKDKLLSRVHKKRIELDFRDRSPHSENAIHCCKHCAKLFPEKAREVMSCHSAPPAIDFRGRLARRHEALNPWSLTRTVTSLHRLGMSWTAVYWFLWGLIQALMCEDCGEVFLAGDLGECRSHPEEACFTAERAERDEKGGRDNSSAAGRGREGVLLEGHHPCCRQKVYRFTLEPGPLGCVTGDHRVLEKDENALVLKVLRLQRHNITYQDWRAAVHEETREAVENVLGIGGNDGGGTWGPGRHDFAPPLASGDGGPPARDGFTTQALFDALGDTLAPPGGVPRNGVNGGGGIGVTVTGTSRPGMNGTREKVVLKRQPSAGKRPPRGATTESTTTTTTTTTTTAPLTAAGTAGDTPTSAGSIASASVSSSNGGAGCTAPFFRTARGTSTASSTEKDSGDTACGSCGEREPKTTGDSGGGGRHASDGAVETNRGGQDAGGVAGGGGGVAEGGGRGDDTMMEETDESLVAREAGAGATTAETTPAVAAAIGAAVGRLENVSRTWELQPFEALSARERGMLPNEHPVQVSPEECRVLWDLVRGGDTRNSTSMGDGALRRWQTDTLREHDGHRMAQMCEELRRKRSTATTNNSDRAAVENGGGGRGGEGALKTIAGRGVKSPPTDAKRASAWEWGGALEGLGSSTTWAGSSSRRISVSSGGDGRRRGL